MPTTEDPKPDAGAESSKLRIDPLLSDFLSANRGVLSLAQHHNLTLDELLQWAESDQTQHDINTVARLAQIRAEAIVAQAKESFAPFGVCPVVAGGCAIRLRMPCLALG